MAGAVPHPALEHYYRHQDPPFLMRNLEKVLKREHAISGMVGDVLEKRAHGFGEESSKEMRALEYSDPDYKAISTLIRPSKRAKFDKTKSDSHLDKSWKKAAKKALHSYERTQYQPLTNGGCNFFKAEFSSSSPHSGISRSVEGILELAVVTDTKSIEVSICTPKVDFLKSQRDSEFYETGLIVTPERLVCLKKPITSRVFLGSSAKAIQRVSASLTLYSGIKITKFTSEIDLNKNTHTLNAIDLAHRSYQLNLDCTIKSVKPLSLLYRAGRRTFGPYSTFKCPFSDREFDTLPKLMEFHDMFHPSIVVRKIFSANPNEIVLNITQHRDSTRQAANILEIFEDNAIASLNEFYFINPFFGACNRGLNAVVPKESVYAKDFFYEEDET